MKHIKNLVMSVIILALLIVPLGISTQPALAQEDETTYTCLPTCEENDGRLLTIAGQGIFTLAGVSIHLGLSAPETHAMLKLGIFDGNTGGRWDVFTGDLEYILYADPLGVGAEDFEVGRWFGADMPDNDWYDIEIPIGQIEALSPSGNYTYHLEARALDPSARFLSNFKVRGDYLVYMIERPFAYIATHTTVADFLDIYPNYPDLQTSTYDGSFEFYLQVPNSQLSFELWDGDVDYGSVDLSTLDTDDPDTPNDSLPAWAIEGGSQPNYEGIAQGYLGSTGFPPDDTYNIYQLRAPNVTYQVTTPNSDVYLNPNPSGNEEWERFRIDTDFADLTDADFHTEDMLPGGVYHIDLNGMDMANLNFWRFSYKVLGVCAIDELGELPAPCRDPLYPYMIGDTVFHDQNGNGIQDDGELGIPGVTVNLLDVTGQPVYDIAGNPLSAVTDAAGFYSFQVQGQTYDHYTGELVVDGTYTTQIAPENFAAGSALADAASTTGGNEMTDTVIDDNVLTYDFGYIYYLDTFTTCTSKVVATTLLYTGPSIPLATVEFYAHPSKAALTYEDVELVSGVTILQMDEQNGFTIDGRVAGVKAEDLGASLTITINGVSEEIHTSCSAPYEIGMPAPLNQSDELFSSNWQIVNFIDKDGPDLVVPIAPAVPAVPEAPVATLAEQTSDTTNNGKGKGNNK
ncbi:SdrD B-like domain-containing protein [Chloroflexota bacterium]